MADSESGLVTWHDPIDPGEIQELEDRLRVELDDRTKKYLSSDVTLDGSTGRFHVAGESYIFGAIAIPEILREQDRVVYHEVDVVLTEDAFVTIRKQHSESGGRFNPNILMQCAPNRRGHSSGEMFYRLMEDVAEAYEDLLTGLQEEIDELESVIGIATDDRIHKRYSELRRDLVDARRNVSPLVRALRAIEDERLDLQDKIFPQQIEILVTDVKGDLERVEEMIPLVADLLSGVRDYHQSYVSQRQNDIVQNLTVVASLLLVPTLIVGIYGQNFDRIPETEWGWGYEWSWLLIVGTTLIQLAIFWRLGWIRRRSSTPVEGQEIGSLLQPDHQGK